MRLQEEARDFIAFTVLASWHRVPDLLDALGVPCQVDIETAIIAFEELQKCLEALDESSTEVGKLEELNEASSLSQCTSGDAGHELLSNPCMAEKQHWHLPYQDRFLRPTQEVQTITDGLNEHTDPALMAWYDDVEAQSSAFVPRNVQLVDLEADAGGDFGLVLSPLAWLFLWFLSLTA